MQELLDFGHRLLTGFFSPHRLMVRSGLVLVAIGGSGFGFQVVAGDVSFSFNSASGLTWINFTLVFSGLALIAIGSLSAMRNADRRRVFALQVQGLRHLPATPLTDQVPARIEGRRESWVLDLRSSLADGQMLAPQVAANAIHAVPTGMMQRADGRDPSDVSFVVAGLAPVPLLILLGYEIDDEFAVAVMDWDREKERWFEPATSKDKIEINVSGLDAINEGTREAAISLSISYGIRAEDVVRQIGNIPHVQIATPITDASKLGHQEQIAKVWFDTMKDLQARGVDQLHLFIACPSSLAIMLGRRYDRRNLPNARIYQYDRSASSPYPWSVELPQNDTPPKVRWHTK